MRFIRLLMTFLVLTTPLLAQEETMTHGLFFNGYVTSTHPGAYHQLHGLTLPGGIVTLEDGSEWVVAPYYWENLEEWTAGDTLLLTLYRPWFFHYYEFKLVNERTHDEVLVNWCRPPRRDNANTRTIARRHAYEIVLDDHTRWRVRGGDRLTTKTWKKDDIIIIGTNNGWFSWGNPNILVNMRNSSYVRGACMP